jgi:hypothetical protein
MSFSRLTKLWASIVCPKIDGHEWHKKSCLMGDYTLCGIGTLKVCTIEKIPSAKTIQWNYQYATVMVGQKDNGDLRKKIAIYGYFNL